MKRILPVIVIAQFLCTSPWFAVNAIMSDLVKEIALDTNFLAHLISAVQLGFILGTLVFAIFAVADRFSPSGVFFISSILAAAFNLLMVQDHLSAGPLLLYRFLTGFFLAGIYPVGMKIASDHYRERLGRSLGWLVGALVIGTALPHLLKSLSLDLPWKAVLFTTSALSLAGGLAIRFLVPDGPYRTKRTTLKLSGLINNFKNKTFRSAAFGYFGHMWELYAFWTFVPAILVNYKTSHPDLVLNIPLLAFLIIGAGGIACVISGVISGYFGAWKIATTALCLSGICCIVSPLVIVSNSAIVFIVFLLIWGMLVVADSPLFSTMVAQNAPEQSRGTALTIVNCVGFSITIVSIQLMNLLSGYLNLRYLFLVLSVGPLLGFWHWWATGINPWPRGKVIK